MTDQEFLSGLNDAQRQRVEQLLSTIAIQAEAIRDLVWEAEIDQGAAWFREQALSSASLLQMAAILKSPKVQAPTLAEINEATREMHEKIKSAMDATRVFETVLGFAVKIAPLVL